jgi:hypothetical protein
MEPSECKIHGSSPSYSVDDPAQTITAVQPSRMCYYTFSNLGATRMGLNGAHASRHALCRVPLIESVRRA